MSVLFPDGFFQDPFVRFWFCCLAAVFIVGFIRIAAILIQRGFQMHRERREQ